VEVGRGGRVGGNLEARFNHTGIDTLETGSILHFLPYPQPTTEMEWVIYNNARGKNMHY
jgi:hypothetical protein